MTHILILQQLFILISLAKIIYSDEDKKRKMS